MAEDKKEFQRRVKAFDEAFEAEDWDKAIELGEAIRTEFPDSFYAGELDAEYLARAYNNRGNSYNELKQFERAIKYFDEAIGLKPDFTEAYNNRGNSHLGLEQYERAFEGYNQAIKLKPDFADAYYNRGNSYNGLEQYERAIKDYNQAIELKSDYAEAYNNRIATYAKLGQYARAIADYDRVIELKPELAVAYIGRGGSYAGLGQHERAIKDYDRAIEIDPENVDAHNNRALAIGRQEAEKATKAIKESYDERLSSITTPAEIDKRFEARKKISEERLNRYREYTGWCIGTLALFVPTIWFDLFNKTEILTGNCETNDCSNFFLITKNISFALTTLFLLSPVFLALRYCTRNARIERHILEDYDRKSIMLLIRNQEGAHIQTLIEHFDKRGTPEMLNKLYHPKQAHAQDSQQDSVLRRLKKIFEEQSEESK